MINPQFEQYLETASMEFLENLSKYSQILSIHHSDADGITAGAIIKQMLNRLKVKYTQTSFNLEISWEKYLSSFNFDPSIPQAIIFSDVCPSGQILIDFLEQFPNIDVYNLDHHLFRPDPTRQMPENVYNCNPTQFGLHGLKEIVGSTLNYLFAKAVSEKNTNLAWLAALGMGGDTLQHINEYTSYNQLVIEEAIELEQVILHEGLCLFGGQNERIDKALAQSILPFVPEVEGDPKIAKTILESLEIIPKKKVKELTIDEVNQIVTRFSNPNLKGKFLTLPKKKGLLEYVFEHAQLISILGHDRPDIATNLLSATQATKEFKQKYLDYIQGIVKNLTTFVKMDKIESTHAIIVNLTGKIPIEMWSDTGSFASINQIYDPSKMLFIGGETKGEFKFSVRTTSQFIESHNNSGVNIVIKKIMDQIGGDGGGHGLAGGIRIPLELLQPLMEQIDSIINNL
ncbi:DHHA1 domain-containing protein [Candidatus Lokiarchaeum ossiferum]|uniref:DHHA1 domain-containing protein n=1 Tax=Candidatus Lokiarchaeum ossiferum TaxID=2951803 RepID=UPI00352C9066